MAVSCTCYRSCTERSIVLKESLVKWENCLGPNNLRLSFVCVSIFISSYWVLACFVFMNTIQCKAPVLFFLWPLCCSHLQTESQAFSSWHVWDGFDPSFYQFKRDAVHHFVLRFSPYVTRVFFLHFSICLETWFALVFLAAATEASLEALQRIHQTSFKS